MKNEHYQLEASLNRTDTGWEYKVKVADKDGDYVETAGSKKDIAMAILDLNYSIMLCLDQCRNQ